jgi:hypothetical protein
MFRASSASSQFKGTSNVKHKPKRKRTAKPSTDKMVRRNVTFSVRHATLLDLERERSGVPTATLLRQLIDKHFGKTGGGKP